MKQAATALFSLTVVFQLPATAQILNITTGVGGQDSLGLIGIVPSGEGMDFNLTEGLKGGFVYGMGIDSVYDSNLFLTEDDTEGELSTNLSPRISYMSDPEGGAPIKLTANYTPVYRSYLENSDLNEFDQSGEVTLRAEGSKTVIAAYGRYSELSGTDRLTGQFVNGSLFTLGLQGSYQVAPRTSLSASWKAAMSDYGTSSIVGSDIYTSHIGGYWSATERFSFGPSIRYSTAESDLSGTRDAWAVFAQAKYKVGERIQIIGSLGLEHASNSREGDSTLGLTGDLAANYAISEKWMWGNAIQYVTVPSPTETNYVINNLSISTVLNRQLLRATLGFGLELNVSEYEGVGTVATNLGTEDNLSTFVSYRRKFFLDRVDFESQIRYSVNDGQEDWSQLQISAGLEVQF
jgi:hypothetical protein